MLNPSRTFVISLVVVALVSLALGLATDIGLFGWSLSVVVAFYLVVTGIAHLIRPRSDSARRAA